MKQAVKRREPSQDRARNTRWLIFEAAARILEDEGLESFNTNRLAELSGFSVGTIYQYFANKQAIMQALARHEQDKTLQQIRRSLPALVGDGAGVAALPGIRAIVRAVLHAFGGRQRARKILIELALQGGRSLEFQRPVSELAALLTSGAATGRGGVAFALTEMDAFVLTQAVIGVIRGALARDERLLKKPEIEDALVGLIEGFVRTRGGAVPRRPPRG